MHADYGPPLRILINAGPWISVPPNGYGGIENVVATLVDALVVAGHRVTLATTGASTARVDRIVHAFAEPQFRMLAGAYSSVAGIAQAHLQAVLEEVHTARAAGDPYDLIHDHMEVVGPAVLGAGGPDLPPVLQTLHWDLHKHPDFYERFDGRGRVFFVGVSASQISRAPRRLADQILGFVPLAVPAESRPPVARADRGDYLLMLGRISPLKGCDVAVRIARRHGIPLVLAGPVAGHDDATALSAALADPRSGSHDSPDVRYFLDRIEPSLDGTSIRWVGNVEGHNKSDLLRRARGAIFPLQWEEPGGTAMVESLAAGTPVLGLGRGVLPSLIEHGRTGWIADDEEQLGGYVGRLDELDPQACQVAASAHTPAAMAASYVEYYRELLARTTVGV